MLPPFPVLFVTPELRGLGTVALLGSATAATYDPATGVGSVTRVDGSNQSYVTFPATNGRGYAINITATGSVLVRNTVTGPVIYGPTTGSTSTALVFGASSAIVITFSGAAGTSSFTINSLRAR